MNPRCCGTDASWIVQGINLAYWYCRECKNEVDPEAFTYDFAPPCFTGPAIQPPVYKGVGIKPPKAGTIPKREFHRWNLSACSVCGISATEVSNGSSIYCDLDYKTKQLTKGIP